MAISDVLLLIVVIFVGIPLTERLKLISKGLPPGPSILTRLLERRSNETLAAKLMRWSKEYGGVYTIMDFVEFGKPTIVLATPQAVIDLLEKRGMIYSSRPRNIVAGEICYRGTRGSILPTGLKQKRFRTIVSSALSTVASKKFRPLETMEAKLMLRDLLLEPDHEKYKNHIQRLVHSVGFCTSYGQRIGHLPPKHVEAYERMEAYFFKHMLPGNYLVEHFPILLWLPRPLQWFRWEADEERVKEEHFFTTCIKRTEASMSSGSSTLGAGRRTLEYQQRFGFDEIDVATFSALPYTAGVTTTIGTFKAFVLAVLLRPHIMKKAQEELDEVVGTNRMPDFDDLDSLPYIRAILKESLRWHPFAPLGVAHAVTEDDVYDGMFIPAGSTVIANIYALTRDPELFPDPNEFKPERFIDNENPLVKNINFGFGFGRRVCPGQHVALDQLYSIISKILWAFDIVSLEDGSKSDEYRRGLHGTFGPSRMLPSLPYKLVPRGDHVASIIMEQAEIAEKEVEAWESFVSDEKLY